MTHRALSAVQTSTDAMNLAQPASDKAKLTLAVAGVTGTLWCAYHQGHADAETGAYLLRNRQKRWMCAACMKKRGIVAPATAEGGSPN